MTSTPPLEPPVNDPSPRRRASAWFDPTTMRGAVVACIVGGLIVWLLVEIVVALPT